MASELDGLDIAALRKLIDRQAIIDCIIKTTRGRDRDDEELFRDAYHPDAVEDHGGYIGGLDGLCGYLDVAMSYFSGYQRYVGNMDIDIDGDEAHVESYYLITLRMENSTTLMMSGGRYLDRLEKRDGEWRIATRVVVGEWTANVEGSAMEGAGQGPSLVGARRDREDASYQRPLRVTRPPTAPAGQ
jgi:hypothetical protein